MVIDDEKITAVLQKTRVVREHLAKICAKPQGPVLRIMDLHWAVEDIYQLKIEMLKVSFEAEHMRGMLERYSNDTARILVRANQPPEMIRFVAVKELCHLIIDEKDDWSHIGTETIKELLKEWELAAKDGVGLKCPPNALQSEFLAEIAAMELIYPFEFRDPDLAKLEGRQTTIAKIALEHKAPAFGIEQALEHHPVLSRLRAALDRAMAA